MTVRRKLMMYLDKDKPCLETNKELAQRFGVVESQINNLLVDLKSKDLVIVKRPEARVREIYLK